MKYRCTHCSHTFELEARDFHRCPNCFWTTSLVELAGEQAATVSASTVSHPVPGRETVPQRLNLRSILKPFLLSVGVAGIILILWFFFFGPAQVGVRIKQDVTRFLLSKAVSKPLEIPAVPKKEISRKVVSLLSDEERTSLVSGFKIDVPRQLTRDEEDILQRRVAPPEPLTQKLQITMWAKEDFDSLVREEQKRRKITLGWLYVRSLKKTFEKNYLAGGDAFEAENYELARELFIRSLSFPVYQNDPERYRAVVLVMLRPYINDVIGKVAVLNQYFLRHSSVGEFQSIFSSYEELFGLFESREWARALESLRELKARIERFESRPQEGLVPYPRSLGEIDTELQNAIRTEAAPKADAVVSWKAMLIDLGLKKEMIEHNLPESLRKAQTEFDAAVQFLNEGHWEQAEQKLRTIEYPAELVHEARKKLALMDQLRAREQVKSA